MRCVNCGWRIWWWQRSCRKSWDDKNLQIDSDFVPQTVSVSIHLRCPPEPVTLITAPGGVGAATLALNLKNKRFK